MAAAEFSLLVALWLEQSSVELCARSSEAACVELAIREMRANLHQMLGIDIIARTAGTTPQSLRKMFARLVGISPKKFYTRLRMNKASQLLQGGMSVAETSDLLGFSSPFHFSRAFRAFHQVSPLSKKRKVNSD